MAIVFCLVIVLALLEAVASEPNGIYSYTKRHKSNNLPKRKVSAEEGQAMIPPSSRCWRSATSILSHVQQGELSKHPIISSLDAAEVCAMLPDEHQKKLALEIARCHLADLGKPLLENSDYEESCNHDLHACLRNLSEAGTHAYTHYVSYVQQLCIRLTQELVLQQQQEAQLEISAEFATMSVKSIEQMHAIQHIAKEMSAEFATMSVKSIEQMHAIQHIAEEHTNQLQVLSKIPEQVKSQLTEELQNELKMTLQTSLKEDLHQHLALQLEQQLNGQLTRLLRDQAVEQATFMSRILENFEARDNDQKERYAKEMKRQQEQIDANRAKMEQLSETVSQASQKMQPLLGLELFMKTMADGYSWMELIVYFLDSLVVLWVLTRPKRCDSFRAYLYGLVFVEMAAEVRLLCLYHHGMIDKDEQASVVPDLRNLVFGLECAIYVLGLLSTLFRSRKGGHEPTSLDNEDTANLEMQRILQELRENQLSRQRRLDAEWFAPSFIPNGQVPIQEYHRPVERGAAVHVSEISPFQHPPQRYRPISHDFSAQAPRDQWLVVPVEQTAPTAPILTTPRASLSNYNRTLAPWDPSRPCISHTPSLAVPSQTTAEVTHQSQLAPRRHADQTSNSSNDAVEEGSLHTDEPQSNEVSQGDRKRSAAAVGEESSDRPSKKAKLEHEGSE